MRTKRRGGVFVISIAVLAGLVAIVAAAAATQRLVFRAQSNRMQMDRARVAAEAGVNRALASLTTITEGQAPLPSDEWATLGQDGSASFVVGGASFRMQIVDAGSRLNINTISQEQLELLPLTPEQIDALLDWRSPEPNARPQGAKDEYYNQLPNGYNTKLRRFDTVDELLLVKDFTPNTLYEIQENVNNTAAVRPGSVENQSVLAELFTTDSLSRNLSASGQTKLNVNTAQVNAIRDRLGGLQFQQVAQNIFNARPYTDIGRVLTVPGVNLETARTILNEFTITGTTPVEGKLNLNTVSEEVLYAIPNFPPDLASGILSRQDAGGFLGLGDLVDVPGITLPLLQQTANYFTTDTQSFIVRVIGRSGDAQVAIEAVVIMENNVPRIRRIEQPPYSDVLQRWNWETETTTETVLKEPA